MRFLLTLVALFTVLGGVVTCSRNTSATQPSAHVLFTKQNAKYKLTCTFYGYSDHEDSGKVYTVTEYVTIKAESSGHELRYVPIDSDGLKTDRGFFTDVWSPDEELLVLPLGRFDGFSIMKSSEALDRIANSKFNDFVRVDMTNGNRLWHEFVGWQDSASFKFSAGLSGDQVPFMYNIHDHKLSTPKYEGETFIGVNSQGKLPVSMPKRP